MGKDLDNKITQSILLIRHAYRHCKHRGLRLELAYSGGKDSDVLVELCKMAGVWGTDVLRPLHRCTTIDPSGTLRHCLDVGVEIMRPRKSFRDCIISSGFPSRWYRHCCGSLKEFAVEDYVLVGVRRSESTLRAKTYKEPEVCRTYNGRGKCVQFLPLLDWSDADVRDFVINRGIRCHSLYYDGDGSFNVSRRLGCVGCPLASRKNRIADFERNPRFVRFWCKAGAEYLLRHDNCSARNNFRDVFEYFCCNLYFDKIADFKKSLHEGFFGDGENACKLYLEQKFGVNLDF